MEQDLPPSPVSEPKRRPPWAERLKKARIKAGLSQADLGTAIGSSQSTIASYETGQNEPNLAMIVRISAALDVSPGSIAFGGEDLSSGGPMAKVAAHLGKRNTGILVTIIRHIGYALDKADVPIGFERLYLQEKASSGRRDPNEWTFWPMLNLIDRILSAAAALSGDHVADREIDRIITRYSKEASEDGLVKMLRERKNQARNTLTE